MKTKSKAEAAPVSGQHTPGPWKLDEVWMLIMGPHGEEVAAIYSGQPGDAKPNRNVAHDNARLIASAPDLLAQRNALAAALKGCADLLGNSDVRFMICDGGRGHLGEQSLYHRTMNQAKAALALPKGAQ